MPRDGGVAGTLDDLRRGSWYGEMDAYVDDILLAS